MKNKGPIILLIIVAVAAGLRFYGLDMRSLWGDEGHSLFNAYDFSAHNFNYVPVSWWQAVSWPLANTGNLIADAHLPFYYLLLSLWVKLFGVGDLALRSLSILIGLGGILAVYRLARKLFDQKVALLSGCLLAVSPLAVMHSQGIRMYSLVMLLSALSCYYFWELVKGEKGWPKQLAFLLSNCLLAMTHIYGMLIPAAQLIFLLLAWLLDKKRPLQMRVPFIMIVLAGMIVSPFYFKLLQTNLASVLSGSSDMAFSVFPSYLKAGLIFFVLALGETVAPWNFMVVIPAGIVLGFLFVRPVPLYSDRRILFLLTICLAPITIAAFLLKPTMPKYLIIVLPAFLALIAFSVMRIKSELLRLLIVLLIIIPQLISLGNYYSLQEYHNSNQIEPWREVGAVIKGQYRDGDSIIASKYFTAYRLLQYYLPVSEGRQYQLFCLQKDNYWYPGATDRPILVFSNIKNEALDSLHNRRVWFVTHILDDRTFPPGFIDAVRATLLKQYKIESKREYIPYETTLVAKLPIGRHAAGSSRIRIELFVRR